ncbi:MAG: tRNA (adenosine(37)-N6)-threonylcarbamoyltransferase complex dimerization subunit type 1 TsaB [Micromonosporaceae bacterium]|nr:tRNA (adenosine(37)-N6)-threonylcarbamoyltransferase complex dimerization subunit type 1 TsaB [Micromonosporaceae bacterium]
MLVLGLDTATASTTAAVVEVTADRVVGRAERSAVDPRGHAELLAPQVAAVLAEAGAGPADLRAVVAGTGPGPFTGLRVGLATAAAIGQALGIPTYGVCSLDAIGAHADEHWNGRMLVATDARRGELYWAVYTGGAVRVTEPAVSSPEVVAGEVVRLGVSVAMGEGAHRYADRLRVGVRDEGRYPSAYALVDVAADRVRRAAPGEPLVPRYLRRPDAAAPRPPKPVLPR